MEDEFEIIEDEHKNYICIYFFESHEKNNKVKLNLPKKCSEALNLKMVKEIENNINNNYEISLYRFSLYPNLIKKNFKNLEDYEISIQVNNDKSEGKLTNLLFDQNNFIFDLNLDNKKKKKAENLKLPLHFQFEQYIKYLREELNCNKESKENHNLISSIQKTLEEKYEKIDFVTYLLILSECSSSEDYQKHFDLFVQEKIEIKDKIEGEKIKEIQNMLNNLESNLDKILSNNNHKQKEYYKLKFYSILYYFSRNFNKKK